MTPAIAARTTRDVCAHAVIPIARSGIVARAICRRGGRATIAAVFERSFYLRCGDMFVCVAEPIVGNGPLTLIADTTRSLRLRDLGLHAGQPARIDDREIAIGSTVRLAIEQSAVWRPPPWPVAPPPDRLIAHCVRLARRVAIDAPPEGLARTVFRAGEQIASPSAFAHAAATRVARFECWLSEALSHNDSRGESWRSRRQSTTGDSAAELPEAISGLIGLGPGLTPSGDDFLVGAVALLDALAESGLRGALTRALAAAPAALTSELSGCFLRTATAGHVGENLHRAVSSVVFGNVEAAIAAVRRIGHSSGWDMLAGIATTQRVVAAARLKRA